jgi:hypothetical protein
MFHIIDEMSPYLLETMQGRSLMPKILEGVVFVQLGQLEVCCFPPKFVSISGVEFHGVLVISGYLITILVAWCKAIQLKLHLMYKAPEL